ncbi:MAG: hypothetical protein Ct9H300mP16_02560 [Pseudomonadota bacterium]|nr:MAG: hypothetical protein Ct9H300mP16_02560 [Pseudomonadota bacterium]
MEKLLLEDKSLKRTRYRPASILAGSDRWTSYWPVCGPGVWMLRKFKRLDRFQATVLADSGSLKKGGTPPSNPFFDACDAFVASLEELVSVYEQRYAVFRHRLLGFVMTELPARKAARQVQSFDDLLTQLSGALDGPSGQVLAEKIRSDYPAVLIDEFQDTDPVQYRIFWKIYQCSGQPMFMVGDPKQAIYSFRGADVFTYLGARQDAECGYTLDQNWRSTPDPRQRDQPALRAPGGYGRISAGRDCVSEGPAGAPGQALPDRERRRRSSTGHVDAGPGRIRETDT